MATGATQSRTASAAASERISGFGRDAVRQISASLRTLLAGVFVLNLKTTNLHWHAGGSRFAITTCSSMNTL